MRRNQIENFHSALGGLFAYIALTAASRTPHIARIVLKKGNTALCFKKKRFPMKIVVFRYDAEIIITLSIW